MNRESSYQVADVVHISNTGGQIMKSSKSSVRIWRVTGISSIVATIILIGGFIYAISDVLNPVGSTYEGASSTDSTANGTSATNTASAKGTFQIAVLGDSLAKGTGDDDGSGFARRTVDLLQKDGKEAKLIANLGINGQKTASVLSSLEEPGVQHVLQQSNMIFVSIGANDLFNAGEALGNTQQAPSKEQLLANLPKASKTLQQILERISKINPDAHILYLGLYNPFSDLPELRVPGNEAVTTWNTTAMNIINNQANMSLIPTFDLFQQNLNKYLSSDHFHPNGTGYEQIAERVVQSID